ncbi:MAG: hypothetical protein EOO90_28600 [Pedobacter sp.]|nr:MAG: hypothetical protein EOO90_28600 [Pedobacter sp.]
MYSCCRFLCTLNCQFLCSVISRLHKLLDIEICDHIIVTNHNYFSFADECLM